MSTSATTTYPSAETNQKAANNHRPRREYSCITFLPQWSKPYAPYNRDLDTQGFHPVG
jgi:hypothetical protein